MTVLDVQAESEESPDQKGSRATSRSADGPLPEQRSSRKPGRTPASGRGTKRSGAAARQSSEGTPD